MNKRIFLFTVLILALVLSACGPKSDLAKNRDLWDSQGIDHYRFKVSIGCFCAFRDLMPLTIEVQGGKIVSMTDVNGKSVPADYDETFAKAGTAEGLFAIVESGLATADRVDVTYEADRGFPTSIYVDQLKDAADDEISYTVTDFEVLP